MQAVATSPASSLDSGAFQTESQQQSQLGLSKNAGTGLASSAHSLTSNPRLENHDSTPILTNTISGLRDSPSSRTSPKTLNRDALSDVSVAGSMTSTSEKKKRVTALQKTQQARHSIEASEMHSHTSSRSEGASQQQDEKTKEHDDTKEDGENEDSSHKPAWSELKTKAGKERKRLPLACIACRRKKIRCSGEKPACKHCVRSRVPCVYKVTARKAAPRTDYMTMLDKRLKRMEERVLKIIPDADPERMASIGRASIKGSSQQAPKSAGAKKRAADEAFTADMDQWAARISRPEHARPSQSTDLTDSGLLKDGSEHLPSREIQEHLAEVFFDNVYGQAYHLLHKPSFMRKLKAGIVPPVLTLAVCAISARFSYHPEINTEPAFLRGEQWAKPARDIALKRYDEPNMTILIVLLIMSLHEFGTCQGGRSWMLGGMGMRMAHALQLHRELDHDPLGRKRDKTSELSFIDREIRRRTMWACYLMDRFNSSGTERPMMINDFTVEIQLPIKESNFRMEIPGPTESLEGKVPNPISPDAGQVADPQSNMGVAAYIVRSIAIWGRLIRFLNLGGKSRDPYPIWDQRSRHADLKRQVDEFAEKLPAKLRFTNENLQNFASEGVANQFLFLHLIQYQSLLFLHRFAIPTSPTQKRQADIPDEFRNKAGRIAIDAANQISIILSDSISYKLVAPFAGYCAFVSSTVHVTCIHSKNAQLKSASNRHLASNIKFLSTMKKYWGVFYQMVESLRSIYQQFANTTLHGRDGSGEQVSPDTNTFEYGNWFNTYPHGVSSTDYQEPAVSSMDTTGNNDSLSQKSDLQTVEEFFNSVAPSNSAQRKSRKSNGSFSTQKNPQGSGLKLETGGGIMHNRRPSRRHDPNVPLIALSGHTGTSQPPDAANPTGLPNPQMYQAHAQHRQQVRFGSPHTPKQRIASQRQQPTPTSATNPAPPFDSSLYANMPVPLSEMDRQFVFDAYAADPNHAGMMGWDFDMGDATTGVGTMDFQSPVAQMGGMAPNPGGTGQIGNMQAYGDASSAWFMPFNLPPPDVTDGTDYGSYGT